MRREAITKAVMGSAVVLCLALPATADTVSYFDNFAFPLSPGNTTLTLDKFDDAGGTLTLTKVTLVMTAEVGSNITVENDSSLPAPDFEISLTGLVTATAQDLAVTAAMSESWACSLDPNDTFPGTGPDFHDFGYLGDIDADSDEIPPGDLGYYVGSGGDTTFDVNIEGSAGWGFSGSTNATLVVSGLGASGCVTVTYEYVPEPSTICLLACGLLLLRRPS